MAHLIKLTTLNGNSDPIPMLINLNHVNYVHLPYGDRQGKALLRMNRILEKVAHTYAIGETFASVATAHPDFVPALGRDHLTKAGFEGVQAAINLGRIQTIRHASPTAVEVTFADGTHEYFDAALAASVNAGTV